MKAERSRRGTAGEFPPHYHPRSKFWSSLLCRPLDRGFKGFTADRVVAEHTLGRHVAKGCSNQILIGEIIDPLTKQYSFTFSQRGCDDNRSW
jgi:hypothetical protein